MKLNPKTIADMVFGWNIMFSGNKSDAEKAFISAKMYDHFLPIFSDETFRIAARMIEKETNFFPTIKQIMDFKEAAEQKRDIQIAFDPSIKRLTEETGNISQEEIENNLKKVEIIKKQLAGELSMEEALEQQERIKYFSSNN